ncbi:MAG TPA: hypothetical protein DDW65_19505, partial [Firmicutes bacterium]|nr:hypothetical protein [Bacillota bacterium]
MFKMQEKMKLIKTWLVFALLLGCILTVFAFSVGLGATDEPQLAPINLHFIGQQQQQDQSDLAPIKSLLQQKQSLATEQTQTQGRPLGYRPPLFDTSYLSRLETTSESSLALQKKSYPASYDLRSLGKVTSVKDQANCGACWAFATYGSLESCLLPTESRDFSENNLKNTHGFDWAWDTGGNAFMSAAYLTRWSGPINETDDPYNDANGDSPTGLTVQKHVQEIILLPDSDKNAIKNAIMTYGAVTTSMCWDGEIVDAIFNSNTNAYWNFVSKDWTLSGENHGLNHMVTIVGWDDTYSKKNFLQCPSKSAGSPVGYPAGDGAWIVKNSWGTSFGNQGYFYVSYYDQNFAHELVVFMNAESTEDYQHQYEYDTYGLQQGFGFPKSKTANTAWASNVFYATANEPLVAVAFYALAPKTQYSISVYTNVDGSSNNPTKGTLVSEASTSGTIAYAGYHTIKLPAPVQLTTGQKFSIVVKLTTPGYTFPIPIEVRQVGLGIHSPDEDYTSNATSNAGES